MVDGDERILQQLRTDFPGWSFRRHHHEDGRLGDLWATRNHVLTGAEMYAGLAHNLAAGTASEMRAALERQREIDAQVAEAKRLSRWPYPEYAVNAAYH